MNPEVAAAMRAEIARQGLLVRNVADASGISPGSLSHKLRGRRPLKVSELISIAAALNVDPARWLVLDGDRPYGAGQSVVVVPARAKSTSRPPADVPEGYIGGQQRLTTTRANVFERRMMVLDSLNAGTSTQEVAESLGIPVATIYKDRRWLVAEGYLVHSNTAFELEPSIGIEPTSSAGLDASQRVAFGKNELLVGLAVAVQ